MSLKGLGKAAVRVGITGILDAQVPRSRALNLNRALTTPVVQIGPAKLQAEVQSCMFPRI